MLTMNISLPEPIKQWLKAETDTGLYSNNSDYVRDLSRRDKQRAQKLQAFQVAVDEGLASGEPKSFNVDNFLGTMNESLNDG